VTKPAITRITRITSERTRRHKAARVTRFPQPHPSPDSAKALAWERALSELDCHGWTE